MVFSQMSDRVASFVDYPQGNYALIHATVIDGTGGPAALNQTVLVEGDIIKAYGPNLNISEGTTIIDCSGKTIIPGFVMLHEHMFYTQIFEDQFSVGQMSYTFPRLYLAGGVTTARTGGSIEPQTDLNIREAIQNGQMAGPDLDVTGPFITSTPVGILEIAALNTDVEASTIVDYWSAKGATSFKVYQTITSEALKNTIGSAHQAGKKVTGHICSVTYREATDLGIDNLEHGFLCASDFVQDKVKDICDPFARSSSLNALPEDAPVMKELMQHLIDNDVAITSTLNVFEPYTGREPVPGGGLEALNPAVKERVLTGYANRVNRDEGSVRMFKKEMAWEKQFYDMGGLLVAGTDPTGAGRVVPGYANWRLLELLAEAGLSIEDAVSVCTYNGALYLEQQDVKGTIEAGKQADLIIINADLTQDINNIRNTETVFKNGVGYNSRRLMESVKGKVGKY
jgi:imidazolonepropionase-like amidohydrolase